MNKKIVVYYSLEENTHEAAQKIAAQLGADLCRLHVVNDVPPEGMKKFLVGGRKATFGTCDPLEPLSADLNAYDEIILGLPVWAWKCPPAINTLLKMPGIAEKVIGLFTLSGGGDNTSCMKNLTPRVPNMKASVSLADRKCRLASENDDRIAAFVRGLA